MILILDDIRIIDSHDKIPVMIYERSDGYIAEMIISIDRSIIRYLRLLLSGMIPDA
jgi:hypothetical protein